MSNNLLSQDQIIILLQAEAAKRKEGEKQARARAVAARKKRWKLATRLLKGKIA